MERDRRTPTTQRASRPTQRSSRPIQRSSRPIQRSSRPTKRPKRAGSPGGASRAKQASAAKPGRVPRGRFARSDSVARAATAPGCCSACGSNQIEFDEVVHKGRLLLGECRSCSHRWTRLLRPPAVASRSVQRIGVEVAASPSEAA